MIGIAKIFIVVVFGVLEISWKHCTDATGCVQDVHRFFFRRNIPADGCFMTEINGSTA